MNSSPRQHEFERAREARVPVALVADGEPLVRRLIALALAADGFRVLDASDGDELEQWIRRLIVRGTVPRCVDLVVAAQRMPTATGLEVLAYLRRIDSKTPFILITGLEDPAIRGEAERLGASCVLAKPLDLAALRAAARSLASWQAS